MMFTIFKLFSDRDFAPLHLQYLQHLIPATLQRHNLFLWEHLPHVQGSGMSSGLEVTIPGTINFLCETV